WDLPGGDPALDIPAHRGQVVGLDVSRDGRFLLQVTRDDKALVWDLKEGRGLTTPEGSWRSAAFLPDQGGIALARAQGGVATLDYPSGRRRDVAFRRPPAADGGPAAGWGFGLVAVSPDGRWLAAGSPDGPLACVWEVANGRRVHTIRLADRIEPLT